MNTQTEQPIKMITNIFKKKDWEIIQETTTESQMEQMVRLTGQTVTPKYEHQLDKMSRRKHITLLKCRNTGKLKRYVDYI